MNNVLSPKNKPYLILAGIVLVVVAISFLGNFAGWRNAFLTASLPSTPPDAPTNLTITPLYSTNKVTLTWADNSINETFFTLQRSRKADFSSLDTIVGLTSGVLGANVTSFTDTLSPSTTTTYYYRVKAKNDYGSSAWSNVASIIIASPPAPPSSLTITPLYSTNKVTLTWADNSINETFFTLQRSRKADFSSLDTIVGLVSGGLGANVTSFADTLSPSTTTTYYYRIRAKNSYGNSAWSSVASATLRVFTKGTDLNQSPPFDMPTKDPADGSGGTGYSADSNTAQKLCVVKGYAGYISYTTTSWSGFNDERVWWWDSSQNQWLNYSPNGHTTTLGGSVTVNSFPPSGSAGIVIATLTCFVDPGSTLLPTAPSNLQATGISPNQISLSWSDNSAYETNFILERSTIDFTAGASLLAITLPPANATSYSSTGLASSTAYYYRIKAINGAGSSAYSNTASASTTATTTTSSSDQWVVFNSTDLARATTAGCTIVDSIPEAGMTSLTCDSTVAANLNLEKDIKFYFKDVLADNQVRSALVNARPLNINGLGRKIGIIDTGYNYNHSDLVSGYLTGKDFANKDNDVQDCGIGHGSMVASMIVGRGIVDSQLIGVANGAKIISAKVVKSIDCTPWGYGSNFLWAMYWLMDGPDGVYGTADDFMPDVINMSIGSEQYYPSSCDTTGLLSAEKTFKAAVDLAKSRNILVTFSVGNENSSGGISFPSCLSNAIAVGGLNIASTRWVSSLTLGSNYGSSMIKLVAPATSFVASGPITNVVNTGGATFQSGTSFSAPIVAGIIAMVKQVHPAYTAIQVEDALFSTAKYISDSTSGYLDVQGRKRNDTYGYGIVDACRAINYDPVNHVVEPRLTNYFGQYNILNAPSIVGTANGCLISPPQTQAIDTRYTWTIGPVTYYSYDGTILMSLTAAQAKIPAVGNGGQPFDLSIAVDAGSSGRQLLFSWGVSALYPSFVSPNFYCSCGDASLGLFVDNIKVGELTSNTAQDATQPIPASYSLTPGRHILKWRLVGSGNGTYDIVGFITGMKIQ